ncbi:MAG: pyridoxamine 5'-phosphate oxidase family protein, partial [bacterium]
MFGNRDRADFIEKITDFISTVAYSELITVADNIPCIRPMVYVNDALTIYMVSSRAAAKIEQIKQNPHVSVVIIKSFNTQEDTREVIINGLASIVEDEQERKKVFGL